MSNDEALKNLSQNFGTTNELFTDILFLELSLKIRVCSFVLNIAKIKLHTFFCYSKQGFSV